MNLGNARSIDDHPPLALKLCSGLVLTNPNAQWHFELLLQAGVAEEYWAEVVTESRFVDAEGTFHVGHGARLLAEKAYCARASAEGQPYAELRG